MIIENMTIDGLIAEVACSIIRERPDVAPLIKKLTWLVEMVAAKQIDEVCAAEREWIQSKEVGRG